MSNFSAPTFHPKTNKIDDASWIDDHFGKNHYGVFFKSDGITYNPYKWDCERVFPKAQKLIAELESQRDELVAVVREVADAHFDLSLRKQHDTLSYLKHNAQKALAKLDGDA